MRYEGTTVAGGERSRRQFGKILGVAACQSLGAQVESVAWVSDHVEIGIRQPDETTVVFSLERAAEDRPSYLEIGSLSLYYQGADLHPSLDNAIRRVAPRSLSKLRLERFGELIASDPDAGRATEPVPSPSEEEQRDYEAQALLATWGSPSVWSSFFAVAEVARSQLDSLDFFERCTFVQHCDFECLCVNPQLGVPSIPVVLYPWDDRVRRLGWPPWRRSGREEAMAQNQGGLVTTDLDERDVILGKGASKMAAALDSLQGQEVGDMVFCSNTCVPVVAGEDLESIVEEAKKKLDVPILFLTTTPQSMQSVFRDLLVQRRLDAEKSTDPGPKHLINLIGFANDLALTELEELLTAIGVEVNAALLPALDPELIDRMARAGLNVMHPNELWRGHYDQLSLESRIPAISPQAPFGRRGTLRWLHAIAAATGVETDVDLVLRPRLEENQQNWEKLRDRAASFRLGYILRDRDVRHLSDTAQSWGTPLLEATTEMGFSPEIHLVETGVKATTRAREELEELAQQLEVSIDIIGHGDRLDLERGLAASAPDAVYTEHFFDRRLSELGITAFSGQYFERGLQGAVRTLERLLHLCETPFSRRYGRYLRQGSSSAGLVSAFGVERSDEETERSS